MNQSVTKWEELAKAAARDRRRGKRLNLTFSVEIRGVGRDGLPFTEKAKTSEISEIGCRIKSDLPLNRGDIVSIRLLEPPEQPRENEAHLFEIMWTAYNSEGRYLGARKLDNKKLWNVTFPSAAPEGHPEK